MPTSTTSIRLASDLKQKLELAAKKLHRGKSWVIATALTEYFIKLDIPNLAAEARRQSLLATKNTSQEDKHWEENYDDRDWK